MYSTRRKIYFKTPAGLSKILGKIGFLQNLIKFINNDLLQFEEKLLYRTQPNSVDNLYSEEKKTIRLFPKFSKSRELYL